MARKESGSGKGGGVSLPRKEREKMNKLEEKAAELIAIADSFGIEYEIENRLGHDSQDLYLVIINYKTTQGRFYSSVQYSETKKASVETWEHIGSRRERVSLKSLPDFFRYHAEENQKQPQKVSA